MPDEDVDSDILPSETSGCHSESDEVTKIEKLKFKALEDQG